MGRLPRAGLRPGRRGARHDDPRRQDRHGRRHRVPVRHGGLRRPHRREPAAVHPGAQPRRRAARRRGRRARRHPAAGPGGARRGLRPLARPGVRRRGRQRGTRQGRGREPRPHREHRPRPALGAGVRELRRGPVPGRPDRRRVHRRRAEPGCDVPGQALRGLQPGDQPQHGSRRCDRQPAGDAGDLPTAVLHGGDAGQGRLGDVQLLHRQRRVRLPEQRSAGHPRQPVALPRLRHLRLGRCAFHGPVGAGRAGHGDARRNPVRPRLLRAAAEGGGAGRPGAGVRSQRHGVADPAGDVQVRPVRSPADRGADQHRHHARARAEPARTSPRPARCC